jgi:hypothetical protein
MGSIFRFTEPHNSARDPDHNETAADFFCKNPGNNFPAGLHPSAGLGFSIENPASLAGVA